MKQKKALIILGHAFTGWLLCAASMGLGLALTSMNIALLIHAMAAPLIFAGVSFFYFSRHSYTPPLQTALIFAAFMLGMDFFLVALLINHSLDMFTSLLGTWMPLALIFISTFATGYFYTEPVDVVLVKNIPTLNGCNGNR